MRRRFTISVNGAFYERVVAYCDARDLSISGLIEHVFRQDIPPEAVERARGSTNNSGKHHPRVEVTQEMLWRLGHRAARMRQLGHTEITLEQVFDGALNRMLDAMGAP